MGMFYRQWWARSVHNGTTADTQLSFGPGFPEYRVVVRGLARTATLNYERGTNLLCPRTHYQAAEKRACPFEPRL